MSEMETESYRRNHMSKRKTKKQKGNDYREQENAKYSKKHDVCILI